MRVVKRINHNAALLVNDKGTELVALGKGIGFPDGPDEVSLAQIERTFYNVDARYLPLLNEIDPKVMEFSAQIADVARTNISRELSANLPFTLADHISFAIKRCREHMYVQMPLSCDVQQQYPIEFKIAALAHAGIEREFGLSMPRGEMAGIALCIVNSVMASSSKAKSNDVRREERLIEKLVAIIEKGLAIAVDRDAFDYARYDTHVRYLLERVRTGEPLNTDNAALYRPLCEEHPAIAACVDKMAELIEETYHASIVPEEKVYLMLHVNRVYAGNVTGEVLADK